MNCVGSCRANIRHDDFDMVKSKWLLQRFNNRTLCSETQMGRHPCGELWRLLLSETKTMKWCQWKSQLFNDRTEKKSAIPQKHVLLLLQFQISITSCIENEDIFQIPWIAILNSTYGAVSLKEFTLQDAMEIKGNGWLHPKQYLKPEFTKEFDVWVIDSEVDSHLICGSLHPKNE